MKSERTVRLKNREPEAKREAQRLQKGFGGRWSLQSSGLGDLPEEEEAKMLEALKDGTLEAARV